MRFLAQALDNRLRKFFGPNFLFAIAFVINVIGMHAVFDRAQPGVVNSLRHIGLSNMDQHHDRS